MTADKVREGWTAITLDLQDDVTQMHRVGNDPEDVTEVDARAALAACETAAARLRTLLAMMA